MSNVHWLLLARRGYEIRCFVTVRKKEYLPFGQFQEGSHQTNVGRMGTVSGSLRVAQGRLNRAWVAVGERPHREFQREVEGRTAGQRGLLYVAGGACADGALQANRQPDQTAQLSRLPVADA